MSLSILVFLAFNGFSAVIAADPRFAPSPQAPVSTPTSKDPLPEETIDRSSGGASEVLQMSVEEHRKLDARLREKSPRKNVKCTEPGGNEYKSGDKGFDQCVDRCREPWVEAASAHADPVRRRPVPSPRPEQNSDLETKCTISVTIFDTRSN